ncbi:hypothetical protein D3C72_1687300 [compost metagenome]
MPTQAGQPHGGSNFTHEQIDDQQTSSGGAFDLGDPCLCTLFQTVAFQQTDHRQRQQQDQRQVTGIQEALTEFFQDHIQRHQCRQPGDNAGDNHHQHGVKA